MVTDSTLYSQESAQVVVDRLMYFALHRPGEFCEIPLVRYNNQAEEPQGAILVTVDAGGGKTTLADGSEIIHCHDDNGTAIDILLGQPQARGMNIAQIIVGTRR